jgi:transcriptional regulator with XRE-family HTH domain
MVYDRRTELGLTQAELAERAGMKQPAISRIEGGGTVPTLPLLRRLARALDAELSIGFTSRREETALAEEPVEDGPATSETAAEPHIVEAAEHDEALFEAALVKHLAVPSPSDGSREERFDVDLSALHSTVQPIQAKMQRRGRLHRRRPDGLNDWLVAYALLRQSTPDMREFFKSSEVLRVLARSPYELRARQVHASLEALNKRFRLLAAELEDEAERLTDA